MLLCVDEAISRATSRNFGLRMFLMWLIYPLIDLAVDNSFGVSLNNVQLQEIQSSNLSIQQQENQQHS